MSIKPVIDTKATLGENLILVDVTKRYKQKENKETKKFEKTDEFVHVYSVVCLDRKFEKIDIKIEEKKAIVPLDENGKGVGLTDQCFVEFENLVIRPYVSQNWIQLSATADKCIILNDQE